MNIIIMLKKILFGDASNNQPQVGATVGDLQSIPMSEWGANDDIYNGLRFIATMQLRTPLRILAWHGKIHTDKNSAPPQIVTEMWEGLWITNVKTFREIGIDMDEPDSTMASGIGYVNPVEYLPFLVAVREIVEMPDSIENRIEKLRDKPLLGVWRDYVDRHGGIEKIIDYFFPLFIETIPQASAAVVSELLRLKLDTPNLIANTPDAPLLGIKGLGQAKLKVLRDYCASIESNRDSTRLDGVKR